MFNSQKINTDPTPLYRVCMVARNGHTVDWETRATSEDMAVEAAMGVYPKHDVHTVGVTYNRPEFDNSPNPILVEVRAANSATGSDWGSRMMLDALTQDVRTPELFRSLVRESSQEHIDHARKVLEKVANVYVEQ